MVCRGLTEAGSEGSAVGRVRVINTNIRKADGEICFAVWRFQDRVAIQLHGHSLFISVGTVLLDPTCGWAQGVPDKIATYEIRFDTRHSA